jgi:Derlin-2/3
MSGSPEEWYRSLPIITRGYLTGAFATTILCQLEFIQPQLLILDFGALVGSLEVWRLFTNFLFFGNFSMNFCFATAASSRPSASRVGRATCCG